MLFIVDPLKLLYATPAGMSTLGFDDSWNSNEEKPSQC
jgi:hypothetical protein